MSPDTSPDMSCGREGGGGHVAEGCDIATQEGGFIVECTCVCGLYNLTSA